MDFEFDEDQRGLQEIAAEILGKECPASYLRSVVDEDTDPSSLWETFHRLDWPGMTIATEYGGAGASAVELAILLEQLGYVADPTPFLATTTQFVPLVTRCGDEHQRRHFLGAVASEGHTGTLAFADPEGHWNVRESAVKAVESVGRWSLSGSASFVVDGDRADEIAVLAETGSGMQAFVVPAERVKATRSPTLDPSLHVAQVCFDGAAVDDDRRLRESPVVDAAAAALDEALTGIALMTVGACQRALDLVIEHLRGREQFGVSIGSFQAVKHKTVDVYIAIERARALGYFAALLIADGGAEGGAEGDEQRGIAAAMAKAAAGDAQRITLRHGIQLFGGIGFTWENDLHLYVRRAQAGELLFGGAAEHRARIGRELMATRGGRRGAVRCA